MKKRAQSWAAKHPFLLIFLSAMFVLTWVIEVVANVLL